MSTCRRSQHRSIVRVLVTAVAVAALLPSSVASAQDACTALASASIPGTSIVSSTTVAANATTGTPAFCEVQATLSPVAGSKIGAVYRLPANWNGKVLGIGGGGSAGNVTLQGASAGTRARLRGDPERSRPPEHRARPTGRSRSRGRASRTPKPSSTSVIAPRTRRRLSARSWSRASTSVRRSTATGRAARPAADRVSPKCSDIRLTTTA